MAYTAIKGSPTDQTKRLENLLNNYLQDFHLDHQKREQTLINLEESYTESEEQVDLSKEAYGIIAEEQ